MKEPISVSVKREYCRLKRSGITPRVIYNEYYLPNAKDPYSFESFRRLLNLWMKKTFADDETLRSGTYEGFTAHAATVQVNNSGEIVQAWIKQTADEIDPEEFIAALRENVEPYEFETLDDPNADRMLEIPLFDMHWGISFFDYYEPVLKDILELITSRCWERIIIPVGQDFFHNDSIINAVTTKGTVIDKVDMTRAVKDGRRFITTIVDTALKHANNVRVFYSPGNHDRSISWMFMQVLLERYGRDVVDDSMVYRKVVAYGKNSIMFTHGDSRQATAKNLAHIFPITYPEEFAQAKTREVHAGHLHHETEEDVYGVMVRRLSSGTAVDDWSNREDFVGSHKRFMVFEWDTDSLRSIHYI